MKPMILLLALAGAAQAEPLVEVTVPDLSPDEAVGKALFDANCAACHGENAAGSSEKGPPLVHPIYEPGHHGDIAFYHAALNGSRAHHWRFGDMPPVAGIAEADIAAIVTYVRALQRANGID